jgi:hypothetical protein
MSCAIGFSLIFLLVFSFRKKRIRFHQDFIEQEKIMDYGLLVGVHFRHNGQNLLTEGWLVSTFTNSFFSIKVIY